MFRCCLTRCLQPGASACCLIESCWRGRERSSNEIRPSSSSASLTTTQWYLMLVFSVTLRVVSCRNRPCVCVQGSPKSLGRAFAEPEFKPVEQYYQKPKLRFFDISMGRAPAGELLAAFELIELDYSGFGEVTAQSLHLRVKRLLKVSTMCSFSVLPKDIFRFGPGALRSLFIFTSIFTLFNSLNFPTLGNQHSRHLDFLLFFPF